MSHFLEPLERAWGVCQPPISQETWNAVFAATKPNHEFDWMALTWKPQSRMPEVLRGGWPAIRARLACWIAGVPWDMPVHHYSTDGRMHGWKADEYNTHPGAMLWRLRKAYVVQQKQFVKRGAA